LTNNSEPKLGSKDFEQLDKLIRQIDDLEIEIRPDLSSWEQADLAKSLHHYMTEYKRVRRLQLESMKTPQQRSQQVPANIGEEIQENATMLNFCIDGARVHGMVHPGSEIPKKLKECQEELKACQEDNRKLSLQLLEYKNRVLHS